MKYTSILATLILLFVGSNLHAQSINQFDAQGKRHGKWMKKYTNTDQLRYQGQFAHGHEIGVFKFYKKNEDPTKEAILFATKTYTQKNDSVAVVYFTPKGSLLSKGKMVSRQREDLWIYFHPNTEQVMQKESYLHGRLHGEQRIYFENGKLAKIAHYTQGFRDGVTKIFNKKEVLQKYYTYKNGLLDGLVKYFDEQGDITAKGTYKNNQKDGPWKTYKEGKLVKTQIYPLPLKTTPSQK